MVIFMYRPNLSPLSPLANSATTHTDMLLRARELSIPTTVIHNASIMNAVGACGLQLYNFGKKSIACLLL